MPFTDRFERELKERFLRELGDDIWRLINLIRDNDPELASFFQEIEDMDTDRAKTLLASLLITVSAGGTFPKRQD